MELNKAIQILKETVEIDRNIRSYDKGKPFEELSDYSQFCEEKNLAIEKVIAEIEELRGVILKE